MRKKLRDMSDEELLQLADGRALGVHQGNELIRRGILERCARKDEDYFVRRTGIYSSYGLCKVQNVQQVA